MSCQKPRRTGASTRSKDPEEVSKRIRSKGNNNNNVYWEEPWRAAKMVGEASVKVYEAPDVQKRTAGESENEAPRRRFRADKHVCFVKRPIRRPVLDSPEG